MTDQEITAAERGETVGRGWRMLIRVVAVLVLAAATITVATVRQHHQDEERAAHTPSSSSTSASTSSSAPPTTAAEDPLAHAAHEVRLLEDEDARLRKVSMGEAAGISHVDGTVVLGARRAAYSLGDLLRSGAATRVSTSVVLLEQPVVVRRDATLVIDAPGTTLRLLSSAKTVTSLVSWGGSITLQGSAAKRLQVVGWDQAPGADSGDEDSATDDGRAYIRVKDGALHVAHVALSHLGYWSGRTGGLSLTGSSETTAVATVRDTRIDHVQIGFYVSGAQRVRVNGLRVTRPDRHGVELTNRSDDVVLRHLTVTKPGEDGVSVSNGTAHVTLDRARLTGADLYGLDVDGSPLADGPNSAGYGIGNYSGLTVTNSRISGNEAGSARIQSVDHVEIADSGLVASRSALVVRGVSKDVAVSQSTLTSDDGSALILADGVTDASVSDTTLTGHEIGVEVDHSTASFDDNDITVGTGHGIRASGSDAAVSLSGNSISGRGSSAVEGRGGAAVHQDGGNTGSWTYRPGIVMWAERHSAAMPLLLVLVVPVIGLVFVLRRRHQQRELRRIFEESLVARGRAAIATYRPPTPGAGTEPVAEPVVEPVTEPVAEPVVEPVTEPVPEPVPALAGASPTPATLAQRDFESPEEFAIAAVREAGYSPAMVARVLHVPTSRVRDWVDEATAQLAHAGTNEGESSHENGPN